MDNSFTRAFNHECLVDNFPSNVLPSLWAFNDLSSHALLLCKPPVIQIP